jgi:hypothetical protein
MRTIALPVIALAAATPAAAQIRHAPPPKSTAEAAVGALQNPFVQDALTQVILNAADAVLATRVGPVARYVDPDGDVRPNDTIGDVERRRNPAFDQNLRAGTHGAVVATARTGRDAVAMAGELQATSDRLRAALAPVMSAVQGYAARDDYDGQ